MLSSADSKYVAWLSVVCVAVLNTNRIDWQEVVQTSVPRTAGTSDTSSSLNDLQAELTSEKVRQRLLTTIIFFELISFQSKRVDLELQLQVLETQKVVLQQEIVDFKWVSVVVPSSDRILTSSSTITGMHSTTSGPSMRSSKSHGEVQTNTSLSSSVYCITCISVTFLFVHSFVFQMFESRVQELEGELATLRKGKRPAGDQGRPTKVKQEIQLNEMYALDIAVILNRNNSRLRTTEQAS
jgi:hypothetical protein